MARGAKIYAEVVGYGATCDAYHITAPPPRGGRRPRHGPGPDRRRGVPRAGGLHQRPRHLHPPQRLRETAAIKAVFGAHAAKLAVSSTKAMTATCWAPAARWRPSSHRSGPAGRLPARHHPLPGARPGLRSGLYPQPGPGAAVEYALSNSLGFGGHNACVLFKKWEG